MTLNFYSSLVFRSGISKESRASAGVAILLNEKWSGKIHSYGKIPGKDCGGNGNKRGNNEHD